MFTDIPKIIIGLGDVEILFINKATKLAKIVVYLNTTPEEFNTSQLTRDLFDYKKTCAVSYMVTEDWIPPYNEDPEWRIEVEARIKQNK
jgi:hypothetical protein